MDGTYGTHGTRRFVLVVVLVLESGHAEWGGVLEYCAHLELHPPRPRGWECAFEGESSVTDPP
jgi:hypothetical protein